MICVCLPLFEIMLYDAGTMPHHVDAHDIIDACASVSCIACACLLMSAILIMQGRS